MIPVSFLGVLHRHFQRFAERDEHRHLRQQDANECWIEVVRCLQQQLKVSQRNASGSAIQQGVAPTPSANQGVAAYATATGATAGAQAGASATAAGPNQALDSFIDFYFGLKMQAMYALRFCLLTVTVTFPFIAKLAEIIYILGTLMSTSLNCVLMN